MDRSRTLIVALLHFVPAKSLLIATSSEHNSYQVVLFPSVLLSFFNLQRKYSNRQLSQVFCFSSGKYGKEVAPKYQTLYRQTWNFFISFVSRNRFLELLAALLVYISALCYLQDSLYLHRAKMKNDQPQDYQAKWLGYNSESIYGGMINIFCNIKSEKTFFNWAEHMTNSLPTYVHHRTNKKNGVNWWCFLWNQTGINHIIELKRCEIRCHGLHR